MIPNKLLEILYYIQSKPYYVVYVTSHGRKVKRFIQLAASKEKGTDTFLISKELKSAWWKPEVPIIDGLKFLTFVDLNNAIPLKYKHETEIETGEFLVTEKSKLVISEDVDKQKSEGVKDGKPLQLAEISFPPTLLFQKVEAEFIKQILSIPPNKNEWMTYVFIVGIIVLGFLAFVFMNRGA